MSSFTFIVMKKANNELMCLSLEQDFKIAFPCPEFKLEKSTFLKLPKAFIVCLINF